MHTIRRIAPRKVKDTMNDNQAQLTPGTLEETQKQPAIQAQAEAVANFAKRVETLMYHADTQGQKDTQKQHLWQEWTKHLGELWEKVRRHA